MKRKPSLADALKQSSGATEAEPLPPATNSPQPQPIARPPSRVGKKTIAGHFDPAVSRQLRRLALEEDSSVQELLREALNDLFRKKGKSPIA
jgi:hypothetical protein